MTLPSGPSFSPLRVALRDGRHCVLRQSRIEDDAALLELERAVVRGREGMVKYEDEVPADVRAYAAHREGGRLTATDGTAFCLVAEEEGHGVVAEASLVRMPYRMIRHGALLAIDVHPVAQGIGIGRALLTHLLAWTRAHRDADGGRVLRVELYVRGDNTRAMNLYRSLGFELEGTRRAFTRRDDGVFVDDLVMGLLFAD